MTVPTRDGLAAILNSVDLFPVKWSSRHVSRLGRRPHRQSQRQVRRIPQGTVRLVIMSELPPRPDTETGEPKPPNAPFQYPHDGVSGRKSSRVPSTPEGQGPTLEHYRESEIAVWLTAPVVPLVLLLIAIWHSGLIALTYWFTWVFLIISYLISVFQGRRSVLTAGSDWVRYRKTWVRTYELIRIHYTPAAQGMRHDVVLDESSHGVVIPIEVLQSNKQLWDYVHLGMRHSVANGAKVTRSARNQFPELRADEPRSDTGEDQPNNERSQLDMNHKNEGH